jgi:aryl-alcohol dehydrogenase-like predicted oxidoreductase
MSTFIPSRLMFGTMASTRTYDDHADVSEAEAALREGLERGIRWLHCAEHYGMGEAFALLRRVLARHPAADAVKVVAKLDVHPERFVEGPEGILSTLRGLGRERIDYAQLVPWSPWAGSSVLPVMRILDDLEHGGPLLERIQIHREAGRLGHVGIEVFEPAQARRAAAIAGIDFIVADHSILRRVVHAGAVPLAVARGQVELFAIRPLAGGWLTSRYQRLDDFALEDRRREWYASGEALRACVEPLLREHGLDWVEAALRFLHQHPHPQRIAVGMRTVAHVRAATAEHMSEPLPQALYDALDAAIAQPAALEPDD